GFGQLTDKPQGNGRPSGKALGRMLLAGTAQNEGKLRIMAAIKDAAQPFVSGQEAVDFDTLKRPISML
ncbi:MAG TPA: hypothetical protein VGQ88_09085, partial [Burkholderiales bacterium]|nr:hypothetical protein [Burkholderiales bacterium]